MICEVKGNLTLNVSSNLTINIYSKRVMTFVFALKRHEKAILEVFLQEVSDSQ